MLLLVGQQTIVGVMGMVIVRVATSWRNEHISTTVQCCVVLGGEVPGGGCRGGVNRSKNHNNRSTTGGRHDSGDTWVELIGGGSGGGAG